MKWINRVDEMPPQDCYILVFSPSAGNPMRYRTLNSQFFALMTDATHWSFLTPPNAS